MKPLRNLVTAVLVATAFVGAPSAQRVANGTTDAATSAAVSVPAGYVIGAEDVLSIVFWRDKEMSGEVTVRPDGKISLPLLNDVHAAGYTPEQLRTELMKAASRYVEDPNATVVVKQINSRKVFITGMIAKPGTYPLTGSMTVLQFIASAGGLLEYADAKNILIVRTENGRERQTKFNYDDIIRGKNVQQNVPLRPGDTIVVP